MSIGVNSLSAWELLLPADRTGSAANAPKMAAQADTLALKKPAENQGRRARQHKTMQADREIRNAAATLPATRTMTERDLDQKLVERAQQGDNRAFDALVLKYQQRVIQLVARFVNDGDAPDVAQEAFIKAYRALPNFRGQSAFYTWLYRIAINTAKNFLVSRKRRPADQDIDVADAELYGHTAHLSDSDTPEAAVLTEEIRKVVMSTIEQLPPDLRTAISLREFDGLSYEDIAAAMDCPVGTVRSRIFRARAAIDENLRPLLEQF